MTQFTRTKKLTDYAYSPTDPASEDAIRLQVDNSIQETMDILYSTASGKGASQIGIEGGSYATVQLLSEAIQDGQTGFVPLDLSVTNAKLATDVKVGSLALLDALLAGFTSNITVAINKIVSFIGDLSMLTTIVKTSLVASINEVDGDLALKANKTQEAWITPTLLNGWTSAGGYPIRYYKDEFGIVHIFGVVVSGTTTDGITLFNLPSGYRSTNEHAFNIVISPDGATFSPRLIVITPLGVVKSQGTLSTVVYLDGISFRAGA